MEGGGAGGSEVEIYGSVVPDLETVYLNPFCVRKSVFLPIHLDNTKTTIVTYQESKSFTQN